MATISVPAAIHSPTEDAEQLHQAFKGWGTNESKIISILAHRNSEQRMLIRKVYFEIYGDDLLKSLEKELSLDFEKLVRLWTLSPPERDAFLANSVLQKWKPGDRILIEISCSRSSEELLLVRKAYHALYKKSLEEEIGFRANREIRKLLLLLVSSYRYEGKEVDEEIAELEAGVLHEKVHGEAYDDDDVIKILSTRSKAQLAVTFDQYTKLFGKPFLKDLERETQNEYLSMLAASVQCLSSPEDYFEEVLRTAINKRGTDENALTRVVATRAEVDLKRIMEAYYKQNNVSLAKAIEDDTSGDYKAMLLALIGHDAS